MLLFLPGEGDVSPTLSPKTTPLPFPLPQSVTGSLCWQVFCVPAGNKEKERAFVCAEQEEHQQLGSLRKTWDGRIPLPMLTLRLCDFGSCSAFSLTSLALPHFPPVSARNIKQRSPRKLISRVHNDCVDFCVLAFILLISVSFSFEITYSQSFLRGNRSLLSSALCISLYTYTRSHFGLSDSVLCAKEHVFLQNGEKPPPPTLHILSWIQASRKWVPQREKSDS